MKKIFFSSIFLLAIFQMMAQTPITIDVNDIADGGSSYVVSTANPLDDFDLISTGENVIWDFSWLANVAQDTIEWLDATDTNPAYFLLWFSADVAEAFTDGITIDTLFSLEDVYNFYDRSSSSLKQTGIAGTIESIPLPSGFSEPDVVYAFPLEFGDIDNSVSDYLFDLFGLASFSETRNRTTEVDGWGTIITPTESLECIRLKAEIIIDDILESSGVEIPISYTNYEYKWLAKEKGIPILQINTTDIGGFETITRVAYQDTSIIVVDIQDPIFSNDHLHVSPNPTQDYFTIHFNQQIKQSISVELIDVAGNLKYKSNAQTLGTGLNTISYSLKEQNIGTGIYFIKIFSGETLIGLKKLIFIP